MKSLYLVLFTLFLSTISFNMYADPTDCMSKSEAEDLAKKIKNQYIVRYCDCCADVNKDAQVKGALFLVTSVSIVTCQYDSDRFSVRMTTSFVSSFNVGDSKPVFVGNVNDTDSDPLDSNATLNYHFYWDGKKAKQLGFLIGNTDGIGGCSGLSQFPNPKDVNNKGFTNWYNDKSN